MKDYICGARGLENDRKLFRHVEMVGTIDSIQDTVRVMKDASWLREEFGMDSLVNTSLTLCGRSIRLLSAHEDLHARHLMKRPLQDQRREEQTGSSGAPTGSLQDRCDSPGTDATIAADRTASLLSLGPLRYADPCSCASTQGIVAVLTP